MHIWTGTLLSNQTTHRFCHVDKCPKETILQQGEYCENQCTIWHIIHQCPSWWAELLSGWGSGSGSSATLPRGDTVCSLAGDSRTLPQTHLDLHNTFTAALAARLGRHPTTLTRLALKWISLVKWTIYVKTLRNHAIFFSWCFFPCFHTSPLLPWDKSVTPCARWQGEWGH